MKKTSKKVDVLKHFNDKRDSKVKEVMATRTAAKKKFMDGGTAGVANSYNPVEGYKVNKGVGKSYMSPNPAPAFKKGGVKKYQTGGAPVIKESGAKAYWEKFPKQRHKVVKATFKKGGSTKKK